MNAMIYTTNTGSTEHYAKLLAQKTGLPVYSLVEAKKRVFAGAEVIYLGWIMAGSVKGFLAELVEAMYDELFALQSTHLCNMKQNGYQNAAFECFALMPFYDIVSFTAATTITGILSSLSVTLPPFDWRVFLHTSCETERSTV